MASRNIWLKLSSGIPLVRLSRFAVVVHAIVSRFPHRWLNVTYFPLAPLEMNNRTSESDVPTYNTLVGKSVCGFPCGVAGSLLGMNLQRLWALQQVCIHDIIRSKVCTDALSSLMGRPATSPDCAAALSYLSLAQYRLRRIRQTFISNYF
jgi:hypothetical protein